jgi:hypothetical protein
MIQKVLLVTLILIAAQAIHLNQNHEAALKPGKATLKTDFGFYLRVCSKCGVFQPDAVSVEKKNDTDSIWTIEVYGDKVALKGSNGKYLHRCNDCWPGALNKDSAFVNAKTPVYYASFTPE